MAISEKKFPDVVLHGDLSGTVFVVPLKINICIFLLLPVDSDHVVFLKCGEETLRVFFAHIFDAKIIDYYTEHDGAPFVEPKAEGGGGFIVPFGIEALAEEVVGKFSSQGESIHTFTDAKVYPTIACMGGEVVFGYELFGNVLEVNADILGAIKGCAKVEVLYVKAHKACAFMVEDYII